MTIKNDASAILFVASPKTPTDTLIYGFLAALWLKGDTLSSLTWSATTDAGVPTSDLTFTNSTIDTPTHTIATVKIAGGISQTNYNVYLTFTTVAGNGPKTVGFRLPII